jgi:hypothetical protein
LIELIDLGKGITKTVSSSHVIERVEAGFIPSQSYHETIFVKVSVPCSIYEILKVAQIGKVKAGTGITGS